MSSNRLLKAEEVAERLSLSISAVYKKMKDGEIPSVRIGKGTVRVPEALLERMLVPEEEIPAIPYESIRRTPADAAAEFEQATSHTPHAFAAAWRSGDIEDTPENAALAIRALELRAALDGASQLA